MLTYADVYSHRQGLDRESEGHEQGRARQHDGPGIARRYTAVFYFYLREYISWPVSESASERESFRDIEIAAQDCCL